MRQIWFHVAVAVLAAVVSGLAGGVASQADLQRWLRQLGSRAEQQRAAARRHLIQTGPAFCDYVSRRQRSLSSRQRLELVPVLAAIKAPAAGERLAALAVEDASAGVRAAAVEALRGRLDDGARRALVAGCQERSDRTREHAVEAVCRTGDIASVEALVDSLANAVRKQQRGGGALGMNFRSSSVAGQDSYRSAYQVGQGPNAIRGEQVIRMPVIRSTTIQTQVQLPVVQSLAAITGRDFGTDVGQWRAWVRQHGHKVFSGTADATGAATQH